MHIQNPCGFFSNPQGFYVFAFCNTHQNRILTNYIEPTSMKWTFLNIIAKTSITILTSTITSPCSIFQ